MLVVFSDSTPDSVNKSLGFAKTSVKKGLESLPANRDVNSVFYLTLVLLPAEQGGILQESNRKQNSIWACGIGGGKVIFALLEEIVTLQVSFTLINIWELSFQKPLTWVFIVRSGGNNGGGNRCKRSRISNSPKDPLKVIF